MTKVKQKLSPLLQLCDITKVYGKGEAAVEVLHSVNLEVYQGEMVAIMGQSGSGKSTLMNIIGTLDKASSGKYYLAGKDINSFDKNELASWRNRKIGFVFQSCNLLPRLSVAQNIARPMLYGNIDKAEQMPRVIDELKRVGLEAKLHSYPLKLSGGQQQRVAIARALIMHPDLILADEPTGALDSKTAAAVMKELVQINRERGTTIIIVTHDQNTTNYTQRIVEIKDGVMVSKNSCFLN